MAIYSRCVNARQKLDHVLPQHFPWCQDWARRAEAAVRRLRGPQGGGRRARLRRPAALSGTPCWPTPKAGPVVRKLFDCVLVDEYQDTNALQAEILYRLSPEGKGLTVVGDDAQSIYSFRAATVRNILDFPKHYPDATIVTLEQNYRSTQPILEATNQVIGLATRAVHQEPLVRAGRGRAAACWSPARTRTTRPSTSSAGSWSTARRASTCGGRPCCSARRTTACCWKPNWPAPNIPFHKYGGLKFVETAHVKDLLAFLRLAENPRDVVSGTRLLPLLPGIGPGKARQLDGHARRRPAATSPSGPSGSRRPAAAKLWPKFVALLAGPGRARRTTCRPRSTACGSSTRRCWRRSTTTPQPRLRDLEQLEQIASRYRSRQRMLLEMTLDPPSSTQDLAGPPLLDDDYLVLSTIHSAKGLEWDAVYVIHAADGNIPSDMATKDAGGDRGGAAAVLRGPDAGEELALRLLPAALLPLPRHERPARLRPADAVPRREGDRRLPTPRHRPGCSARPGRRSTSWQKPTAPRSGGKRNACGANDRRALSTRNLGIGVPLAPPVRERDVCRYHRTGGASGTPILICDTAPGRLPATATDTGRSLPRGRSIRPGESPRAARRTCSTAFR